MRAARVGTAIGAAALMVCTLPSFTASQTHRRGPPGIRIYSPSGTDVINASTYVTPEILLSEDAYVFSVAMDLDGQLRVLHPDFPGISVKVSAHKHLRLPNFFAGFNQTPYDESYSSVQFHGSTPLDDDIRGTVIALASRAPFNLEQIQRGGDWDMVTIRQLIEDRTPQAAMSELARYIGAEGEPIGRDYMRFAGGSNNSYAEDFYAQSYYSSNYSTCDLYYGAGWVRLSQIARSRASRQANANLVGYDFCGFPIISYGPVTGGGPVIGRRNPLPGKPRLPGDTTVFPKSRLPHGTPRHPPQSALATPKGVFPMPHRELPQMGDVTITAPKGRRSEPGQILDAYRSQRGMPVPQGRMPIERTVSSREPSAGTGAQPLREARPEPRVESPPPSRAPVRYNPPPPVIHEKPSAPSSPPPARAEPQTTKPEPLRTPPQDRQ